AGGFFTKKEAAPRLDDGEGVAADVQYFADLLPYHGGEDAPECRAAAVEGGEAVGQAREEAPLRRAEEVVGRGGRQAAVGRAVDAPVPRDAVVGADARLAGDPQRRVREQDVGGAVAADHRRGQQDAVAPQAAVAGKHAQVPAGGQDVAAAGVAREGFDGAAAVAPAHPEKADA